jgi:hypothetical protein
MRSLGLSVPQGATAKRVKATAIGFDIDVVVDHFDFATNAAADRAIDELMDEAHKAGKPLSANACMIDGDAFVMFVLANMDCEEKFFPNPAGDEESRNVFFKECRKIIDADMELLSTFSKLVGKPVRYWYTDGRKVPPAADDGSLTILIGARPPGLTKLDKLVKEMFGHKLWPDERIYYLRTHARGRGRLIEDGGTAVWQALGSTYYHLCLANGLDQDPVVRLTVLAKSLTSLYADLVEATPTTEVDATTEELEEYAEEQVDVLLAGFRTGIQHLDLQIEQLQDELIAKMRDRTLRVARYDAMRASSFVTDLRARLPDELDAIRAIEGVTSVRIIDDGIHIGTTPVVMEKAGRRYDLGPFVIRLQADGNVEVWSDDPRHPQGHHHPHIASDSLTCYGNVTLAIMKQMSAFRFADTATIVMRWLRLYAPETTIHKLEEFPSEPIDMNDGHSQSANAQEVCHA